MTNFVRLWLPIALGASLVHASDVAVVVDVSGTMGRYGSWQPDALNLIEALTAGSSLDNIRFSSTGEAKSAAQFKLATGEGLVLLKFGSVQTDAYPFFSAAQKVSSAAELRSVFPNLPTAFREKQTNKDLALAVGARLAGTSPARMIVISDFLSDADVSQQQQQYINQFQSQNKLETPIIYTWLTDKRVLVKVMIATGGEVVKPPDAKPETPKDETPKISEHQVQILEARQLDGSPSRHQFRWRLTPTGQVKAYRLTLRDAKTRRVVVDQPGLVTPSMAITTPDPGDYFAIITADLEDGSQAVSRQYPLKVEGNYTGAILAVLGVIGVAAGLFFFLRNANKRQRPANQHQKEDYR